MLLNTQIRCHSLFKLAVGCACLVMLNVFSIQSFAEKVEQEEWFDAISVGDVRQIPDGLLERQGIDLAQYLLPLLDSDNRSVRRRAETEVLRIYYFVDSDADKNALTRDLLDSIGPNPMPSRLSSFFDLLDANYYTPDMKRMIGRCLAEPLRRGELDYEEARIAVRILGRGMMTDYRRDIEATLAVPPRTIVFRDTPEWNYYWLALTTSARMGSSGNLQRAIRYYEQAKAPLPKYGEALGGLAWTRQREVLDILMGLLDNQSWIREPRGDVLGTKVSERAATWALNFFEEPPSKESRPESIKWLKENYENGTLPPITMNTR